MEAGANLASLTLLAKQINPYFSGYQSGPRTVSLPAREGLERKMAQRSFLAETLAEGGREMKPFKTAVPALVVLVLGVTVAPVAAQEFTMDPAAEPETEYSPYINQSFPQRVFWGDTHVHTTYSPDAGMVGNFNLGPADAYRFARGEQVQANNGMQTKLVRPLDFLVVADHSEYQQGLMPKLRGGDPELLKNEVGKRWYNWFKEGPEGQYRVFSEFAEDLNNNAGRIPFDKIARSTWDLMTETDDEYDDPGQFTAFIGYEWTSTPQGNNLHRVVIFKDGAGKAGQVVPFSSFDSADPEDLWGYLADYEANTGGRAIAIPHNSNYRMV